MSARSIFNENPPEVGVRRLDETKSACSILIPSPDLLFCFETGAIGGSWWPGDGMALLDDDGTGGSWPDDGMALLLLDDDGTGSRPEGRR